MNEVEDEEGKVAVRVRAEAPPAAPVWRPTRPERVSCIQRPITSAETPGVLSAAWTL